MKTILSIPEPCHENWEQMTPVEQGRFCAVCSKTLTDFSGMSDQELLYQINRKGSKMCGRFSAEQIGRMLTPAAKPRYRNAWMLFVAGLFSSFSAVAQQKLPDYEMKGVVVIGANDGKTQKKGKPDDEGGVKKVSGRVLAALTLKPVAGASVYIPAIGKTIVTDAEGRFNFLYEGKDQVLEVEVSAAGMEKTGIMVTPQKETSIQVYLDPVKVSSVMDNSTDTIPMTPLILEDSLRPVVGLVVGMLVERKEVGFGEKVKRQWDDVLPEIVKTKDIKVMPNPVAAGQPARIQLNVAEGGDYIIEILDASGRVMDRSNQTILKGGLQLDLPTESWWGKGVYWIRISSMLNNKAYNGKLIIQ